MTLLGGAVYAGFFAVAALWLVATNPDNADDANGQDWADCPGGAGEPVRPGIY